MHTSNKKAAVQLLWIRMPAGRCHEVVKLLASHTQADLKEWLKLQYCVFANLVIFLTTRGRRIWNPGHTRWCSYSIGYKDHLYHIMLVKTVTWLKINRASGTMLAETKCRLSPKRFRFIIYFFKFCLLSICLCFVVLKI
jgi:hypothetical protein